MLNGSISFFCNKLRRKLSFLQMMRKRIAGLSRVDAGLLINAPQGPQGRRYPVYYGFSAPGTLDPTYRFVTSSGTTRK